MSAPVIPDSVNVSHSIIGCDVSHIYVTQGRTRFLLQEVSNGTVDPQQVIEWVHTLALSPQAAYQLAMGLSTICQEYAQRYGPIPVDKAFVAKIAGMRDGAVQ